MKTAILLLVVVVVAIDARATRRRRQGEGALGEAPLFNSFSNVGFGRQGIAPNNVNNALSNGVSSLMSNIASNQRLGLGFQPQPNLDVLNQQSNVDFQGLTSGQFAGLAPIPVPGFPGPQDIPKIPGVNTIPGLDMWNYLVGQLVPQTVPAANQLLDGSLSRILPQQQSKDIATSVFKAMQPKSADIDVDRMMGRWFQVINSPHVIREACTVTHFGALTNTTYSATFTILKFYREGNANGPPRFSLGYGFKSGETGQFTIHNSNSPDSEPFWVVKVGPLNQFNQYDYAIISNWVKFPVFVIARDPETFQKYYMREVLEYLEENQYINFMTKAFNLISPVDYSQCQYTPTFSGAGK